LSIQNLLVNGCSYTSDEYNKSKHTDFKTWAKLSHETLGSTNYCNLAKGGAGNFYICNSTINFIETHKPDPDHTLIIIMWSGIGRKDLRISGEWWFHLNKTYPWGAQTIDEDYYLFSGGLNASWMTDVQVKKIFNPLYKISDPLSLTMDSLMLFTYLSTYLEQKKYKYLFTSFHNCWSESEMSSTGGGDYSIGYFCKELDLYKNFDFSKWFFANNNKDCFGEYAYSLNEMDQTHHPSDIAHRLFAENYVIPEVNKLICNDTKQE